MNRTLRLFAGGAVLAAGLWFLAAAVAAPALPKDTFKKVVETDIAQLKSHLAKVNSEPTEGRRYSPTIKALAMMLAMYGEAAGDEALRTAALKIAEGSQKLIKESAKKGNDAGIKEAASALSQIAQTLTYKPGDKPLAPAGLEKMDLFSLEEVMSPFRGKTVGGLNIDRDIRELAKKPDVAAIEILAARTAVLGQYMLTKPNEKAAVNKANKDKWEKWSQETIDLSLKIAEEAGKKGADTKALAGLLTKLNAKCSDCHNSFRDD